MLQQHWDCAPRLARAALAPEGSARRSASKKSTRPINRQTNRRICRMKRISFFISVGAVAGATWLMAQQPAELSLVDGFRTVEVASVSDAMEQLYSQRAYMAHDMRPLTATKFAGPAVTVQLKKEEHKEGSAASQGMLDAIDASPAGSVYVMVLEDGADYAGIGGLMATAVKYPRLARAGIDAPLPNTPPIRKLRRTRPSLRARR